MKVDLIDHPAHYNVAGAECECGKYIECIDVTRHLNFNLGNAIKYIWRHDSKGDPIQDLQKAIWYLNDEIKRLEKRVEVSRADIMYGDSPQLPAPTAKKKRGRKKKIA